MRFTTYLLALGVLIFTTPALGEQWYKGVTHVHSFWSDGDAAPEAITAWYKERGYNFVCLTDHGRLQEGEKWVTVSEKSVVSAERVKELQEQFGEDWVTLKTSPSGRRTQMLLKTHVELSAHFNVPGQFLLVPSEEISSGGPNVHTNALNIRESIPGGNGAKSDVLQQHLDVVQYQSEKYGVAMVAHVNHINWSDGITAEELLPVKGLKFFEVYNGHPGTHPWGRANQGMPSYDENWDIILSQRILRYPDTIFYGLATDDSHSYYKWGKGTENPFRGWVVVRAPELSASALMAAMHRGDFYSSTGLSLKDVQHDDKSMTISIDAEPGVNYKIQYVGTRKGFNATSEERLDDNGNPYPRGTRIYSSDIGEVLFETTDTESTYTFTGDELYVRARIFSDKLQENPIRDGDTERAWVQPVRVFIEGK